MDNLSELGNVPQNLINLINEQNNMDVLKSWNKIAVIVKSLEKFEKNRILDIYFRDEGILISRNNGRDYFYLVWKDYKSRERYIMENYQKMGNT